MPLRYTSDIAEHTAVRTAAGLFDLSHMGEIGVTGPDAGRVPRLRPRRQPLRPARAGCALHDDLRRGRRGRRRPDRVPRHRRHVPRRRQRLQPRHGARRVRRADRRVRRRPSRTAPRRRPSSPCRVRARWRSCAPPTGLAEAGHDAETLKYYAAIPMTFEGEPGLRRPHRLHRARTASSSSSTPRSPPPCGGRSSRPASRSGWSPPGLSARDSLRLEAGMPLYGNELDRTTTPHDAGLGRVVKLDKVDDDGQPAPVRRPRRARGAGPVGARARPRRARGPRPAGRPARLPGRALHRAGRRDGRHGDVRCALADPRPPGRDGLRDPRGQRSGHRAGG